METLNRVAEEEVAIFCRPSRDKINDHERQTTSICPIFDHGWCSLPKIGQSLNLSVLVCYKIFDQIHLYFMIFFQSFITMVHDDSVVHYQSHPRQFFHLSFTDVMWTLLSSWASHQHWRQVPLAHCCSFPWCLLDEREKHFQRHNGPKALSTLTHSTALF